MMASELIEELQRLMDMEGDKDVSIDDGLMLRPVKEVDLAAEEDDCICIWIK